MIDEILIKRRVRHGDKTVYCDSVARLSLIWQNHLSYCFLYSYPSLKFLDLGSGDNRAQDFLIELADKIEQIKY